MTIKAIYAIFYSHMCKIVSIQKIIIQHSDDSANTVPIQAIDTFVGVGKRYDRLSKSEDA